MPDLSGFVLSSLCDIGKREITINDLEKQLKEERLKSQWPMIKKELDSLVKNYRNAGDYSVERLFLKLSGQSLPK